ncbi:MAG: universal stress protein [Synergistales bacterium]|nr:universal stress protein [Synergistales bacterium]
MSLQESESQNRGVMKMLQHLSAQRVLLLHVAENEPSPEAPAREKLEALRKQLEEEGFKGEAVIKTGHVATVICSYASERNVGLIVLPWKPKMIVRIALLGSVVRDVIRLSDRPVAVYKAKGVMQRRQSGGVDRIMYATAFQATDSVVMPYLKHEGIKADTLVLLHVGERAPDPRAEKTRRTQVGMNLNRLAGECSGWFGEVETISALGRPSKRIVRQAKQGDVDLIVLGKYDAPSPFGSMLGSTAEMLARTAPCSLLVVPVESLAVTGYSKSGERG